MTIETTDIISAQAAADQEKGAYALPELFLENTKLREPDARELGGRILAFFADPKKVATSRRSFKSYPMSERIVLPERRPNPDVASFDAVIRNRRSARLGEQSPFGVEGLSIDDLADLLFYYYGITETDHGHSTQQVNSDPAAAPIEEGGITFSTKEFVMPPIRRRTCPSGGGLFPLEIYPIVVNVEGVPAGRYHYNAHGHYLERLHPTESEQFPTEARRVLGHANSYENVSVILITTGIPLRTAFKYGDRGYRFLLMEVGHAAQNALLGASALGLAACPVGGFLDDEVNDFLGVNGVDELALYVIVAGKPRAK